MNDTLIQSKILSILQRCHTQIIPEWKECLRNSENSSQNALSLDLNESLEILYEDVTTAIMSDYINPPLPFKCAFPLDRPRIEFRFLFAAERALMKVLFELFDFGVAEWMKIRSLINMAFHRIARSRIDSHCTHCRAAMDEDMWAAHRIEKDLKEYLPQK
jgi:hypothetical protein